MSFKPKPILLKTFVESKVRVVWVYDFQRTGNSSEDICSLQVWSYLTLRVSNKSEFLRRHILGLSLKLGKFMSLKKKRILMKTFVDPQFEVM